MKSNFISAVLCLLCLLSQQLASTHKDNLAPLIEHVQKNKHIKLDDTESIYNFAERILESGLGFEAIEKRLNYYLKNGYAPFRALDRAITMEQDARWIHDRLKKLSENVDPSAQRITALKLNEADRHKVLSIYALCIEPWKDPRIRKERFRPQICDPVKGYHHMRHYSDSVTLRTTSTKKDNARTQAYHLLMSAGQQTCQSEGLSDLEILLMAKCIAERTLKFKTPIRHPLTAGYESAQVALRSPEAAFFKKEGVCSNIAGMAYNVARGLGFKGPLFLARHHLHVFLEAQVDNQWLHFHPMNTPTCSNFIRFDQS